MSPLDLTQPRVLPSLMAADFLRLGEQVEELLAAGARLFHADVMDAHFVPNLALGPLTCEAVAGPVGAAGGMLEVHLMVERPQLLVEIFAPFAGAISVHPEADRHPHRILGMIREAGCLAGLALNPGTPLDHAVELAETLDYVNCMGVDPGFSGQGFIATTPTRVARLRELLPASVAIEVDGGIDRDTLPLAREAGAQLFVSASAIFDAPDPVVSYRELATLAAGR